MSAPDAASVVVRACDLDVRHGRRTVLHDVELTVTAGETVALLGPNGAGKSTLLGALGGRLPVSGTLERHGRIASVLQSPALARRSALANVELALAWWRVPRSARRGRALTALEQMNAAHLADRAALTLSGGEQRRIHLARAIAVSPDLMLLDEPFDGLDPQSHEALRDDTAAVLRAADSAVVIVLHDRADAWAVADRIVVLVEGRIAAVGAPQAVLDAPPTIEVARLLGYDGELHTPGATLVTRPVHVRIDSSGARRGTVTAIVPVEDGARLRIETGDGDVWARHSSVDVRPGDEVSFDLIGGASFPIQ